MRRTGRGDWWAGERENCGGVGPRVRNPGEAEPGEGHRLPEDWAKGSAGGPGGWKRLLGAWPWLLRKERERSFQERRWSQPSLFGVG